MFIFTDGKARGMSADSRCANADQLRHWIEMYAGLSVPARAVCRGHDAPLDYIRAAYFEPAQDLVVWAPRGGGKTRLGALATLLDLLHKPGVGVRILGGSLAQSLRMWEHLLPDLEHAVPHQLTRVRASQRVLLSNGSNVAVLPQSQRAVRGLRVQKLRCDEVELFDPAIWEAAQLVTRRRRRWSAADPSSAGDAAGVIEALSTLHSPFGLMHRIIESAEASGKRIIKWCLLEVLERCPPDRVCDGCLLARECAGVAKTHCDGFVAIDDALRMKRRVSAETWEAEMLCRRPSIRDCVFAGFDPAVHVRETIEGVDESRATMCLAVDFGYAAPFVCLWVREYEPAAAGIVHVVDEYVQPQRTVHEHMDHIEARRWGTVRRLACDPAGAGRNEQTAQSNVALLRARGYQVLHRGSRIVDGVELIRAALAPAAGRPRLFIHSRCPRLIAALQGYHYAPGGSELPVKDGEHDHLVDALRYYFVNRTRREFTSRLY
jgi:hypothetical protein